MSGFLNSIKADLTDRRLLPLVAIVGAILLGAIAYVVLGGGSGASKSVAASPTGPATPSAGLAISQSKPETANAEMTGNVAAQHHGHAHNPFSPVPGVKVASTASAGASAGPSPSSSSSTSSGASGGGSSPAPKASEPAPAKPEEPATPAKPKTVYHVAVLFGLLSPGTTPQTAQLTPYENLKLLTPLPSTQQALVVYRGVTSGGKSATFTLVGEAILHGEGACLPSATQCEAVDLKPGQSEQLEYLPPGGVTQLYELRVTTIAGSKASTASVKGLLLGPQSKAGAALLRGAGLTDMAFLHYTSQPGVLAFSAHHASAARAHGAARGGQRAHHGR
jgi:hypothetical protein